MEPVEDDAESFLRRVRDRLDLVGIELPQIEVRYEHLSVEADVHVGKRALPTLINATVNTLEHSDRCPQLSLAAGSGDLRVPKDTAQGVRKEGKGLRVPKR
ncbi:hypothetical protein QYE76_071617 [Lolium multiflorum]|uniref:Pleiotropic ABC efflux transporter N-terminal domain-containing protein n=1 Tax=Lolium multiflorum TaxID=4521 RepID=A0AAD8SKE0_LOLMU|nr:hypothetical protein QYE76_071617 [Lolium multiflorum]